MNIRNHIFSYSFFANTEPVKTFFEVISEPTIIVSIISSIITLLGVLIGVYISHRGLKKQLKNDPQNAKDYLLIFIELLDNLNILTMGLLYRGRYCPLIEHRVPKFSQNDGEADMSYAQRAHFFFAIGYKIIQNSRKLIFLIPKADLPEALSKVKEINEYLTVTKNEQTKSTLEMIETAILHSVAESKPSNVGSDCDKYYKQLLKLSRDLESIIEKELPELRKI
jgi:hypothetical protein